MPRRTAKDVDNCGTKTARIQIKSDQEPAIVNVQEEIREVRRGKTICTNSPVGESECNGRAENAVRQVQMKVRTFRADIWSGFCILQLPQNALAPQELELRVLI